MRIRKTIFGSTKVKIGDLSEKLVAYYKFDDNFNDSIAGLNGFASRGYVGFNSGLLGKSAVFNPGNGSTIEIPNSPAITFTDGVNDIPFSISYWVYSRDNDSIQVILDKTGGGAGEEFRIGKFGGIGQNLVLFTDNANLIRRASNSADLNTWTHFCATYDGSKSPQGITLYRNGAISQDQGVMEGNYTGMPNTGRNLFVGSLNWTWAWFLNSDLDELYIWKDRVLTMDEVAYAYNQGLTGKTII